MFVRNSLVEIIGMFSVGEYIQEKSMLKDISSNDRE